jgi:hypothetical protein
MQATIGETPVTLDFSKGKVGEYQAGWRALVEGMAGKENDVKRYFIDVLREHNVPNVQHAFAQISQVVSGEATQSKEYLVVERTYNNGGKVTVAVNISSYGKDLYVEWLHYELGVINLPVILGIGCAGTIITFGIGLIVFIPLYLWGVVSGNLRRELTHFEKQDSWALRAVVDSSLKQAIDRSGIAKELVREVPSGQGDVAAKRSLF